MTDGRDQQIREVVQRHVLELIRTDPEIRGALGTVIEGEIKALMGPGTPLFEAIEAAVAKRVGTMLPSDSGYVKASDLRADAFRIRPTRQ